MILKHKSRSAWEQNPLIDANRSSRTSRTSRRPFSTQTEQIYAHLPVSVTNKSQTTKTN